VTVGIPVRRPVGEHEGFLPTTPAGRRAGTALAVFGVAVVVLQLAVVVGQRAHEVIPDNLWLAAPAIVAAVAAALALGYGLIAVVRQKERSAIVLLAVGLGVLITLFVAGELFTTH
jgi:hypothetical protein